MNLLAFKCYCFRFQILNWKCSFLLLLLLYIIAIVIGFVLLSRIIIMERLLNVISIVVVTIYTLFILHHSVRLGYGSQG